MARHLSSLVLAATPSYTGRLPLSIIKLRDPVIYKNCTIENRWTPAGNWIRWPRRRRPRPAGRAGQGSHTRRACPAADERGSPRGGRDRAPRLVGGHEGFDAAGSPRPRRSARRGQPARGGRTARLPWHGGHGGRDGAAWCCSRATWASGQAGHPERRCLSPRPWRANVRGWRRRLVEPGDAAAAASRRAATTCRRRAWDGQRVSPVVPPAGAEVVPAGTADRATCRRSHPHVDPPPADPAEQDLCRAADAVAYPAGDVELAGKELQRRRTRHHG